MRHKKVTLKGCMKRYRRGTHTILGDGEVKGFERKSLRDRIESVGDIYAVFLYAFMLFSILFISFGTIILCFIFNKGFTG